MRRILFVAHHLTIGGVQKSLISALSNIDYEKNEVFLYIRKNRLDLIQYIDERVNVIVNDDKTHYYRQPKVVLWQLLKTFSRNKKEYYANRISDYIRQKQFIYEKTKYFNGEQKYDIAIAYIQGYTALFVDQCVEAEHKIMFYQGSVDEIHSVHEKIFPSFNRIVVEHQNIKELLLQWYPHQQSEKIVILSNYTDQRLLNEFSKEIIFQKETNTYTLCTCSRFSPEKGLDLAVESAKKLKDRGIAFTWYLVGDGPDKEKIEHLVETYQLQKYVIMPGMQKNPYPYMAACDIYVQPSREEALSISMLESQMLCAPMVSTKTAGGLAMIQEGVNGLLADINAESLADTIENLIQNDDLRNSIKDYLRSIDYSEEEIRYKNDWKELLEI